jgi:hypothetical protein
MRQEGRDMQRLRDERKAGRNCGVRAKGLRGGAEWASAEEAELKEKENKAAAEFHEKQVEAAQELVKEATRRVHCDDAEWGVVLKRLQDQLKASYDFIESAREDVGKAKPDRQGDSDLALGFSILRDRVYAAEQALARAEKVPEGVQNVIDDATLRREWCVRLRELHVEGVELVLRSVHLDAELPALQRETEVLRSGGGDSVGLSTATG